MKALGTEDISAALDADGAAVLPGLLSAKACRDTAALFDEGEARFRATVDMNRHGFGSGRYRYFARPLPQRVQSLREQLYAKLAPIADMWAERMALDRRWPPELTGLEAMCAAAGQTRPTPLLLRYGPGDYNRLHQDVYGELMFPLQVVVLLDRPGVDFTGGELVLVEGRPRRQSRAILPKLSRGDGVVIPVRERPVAGRSGWSRAMMRHGVGEVRSGLRRTLGIIFHDAL